MSSTNAAAMAIRSVRRFDRSSDAPSAGFHPRDLRYPGRVARSPETAYGRPVAVDDQQRELILILARDTAALGDVFSSLAECIGVAGLFEVGMRETPAQR